MAETNRKSAHGMPGDCLDHDGWLATLQIHMSGQLGEGHSSDPWEKSPVQPLLEFTYSSDRKLDEHSSDQDDNGLGSQTA
jgi:hypothetical protein